MKKNQKLLVSCLSLSFGFVVLLTLAVVYTLFISFPKKDVEFRQRLFNAINDNNPSALQTKYTKKTGTDKDVVKILNQMDEIFGKVRKVARHEMKPAQKTVSIGKVTLEGPTVTHSCRATEFFIGETGEQGHIVVDYGIWWRIIAVEIKRDSF